MAVTSETRAVSVYFIVYLLSFAWSSDQLSSTGLEDYMKRYGEGITRVLNSFGPVPDLSGSEAAKSIVNVSTMAAEMLLKLHT